MASTSAQTSPTKLPLSERSVNTHLPAEQPTESVHNAGNNSADLKAATTKSMEYHRDVLQEKLEEGQVKSPGHYISPSDAVVSPCTKKLSDLKGKKFKNAGKPQALFAKALGKQSYEKMANAKRAESDTTDMKEHKEDSKET